MRKKDLKTAYIQLHNDFKTVCVECGKLKKHLRDMTYFRDNCWDRAERLEAASFALYTKALWTSDRLTVDEELELWEALKQAFNLVNGPNKPEKIND
jgi:hypothetical protein